MVSVSHAGRGHTDHDLIAVVTGAERTAVFCGDLAEESDDPYIDIDSDVAAWPATIDRCSRPEVTMPFMCPGHGATVDAGFVRRQQRWLARRVTKSNRQL
ncbi:MAG: hypothetical protein ACXWZ2_05670 [Mycobacterium sp.]